MKEKGVENDREEINTQREADINLFKRETAKLIKNIR